MEIATVLIKISITFALNKSNMRIIILIACFLNSVINYASTYEVNSRIEKIDHLDSVIFDMKKAVIKTGGFIEIPIYIKSDDVINALDFQMKFNNANIEYASVIDHTGQLQFEGYYNPQDFTLRFTSNSLSNYKKTDKVISVRFKVLKGKIEGKDITSRTTYLNGDICSSRVNEETFLINGVEDELDAAIAKIYPNPVAHLLNIELKEEATVMILDLAGKMIYNDEQHISKVHTLDVQNIPSGHYYIKVKGQNIDGIKQISILH
jgi:hypothetical protein